MKSASCSPLLLRPRARRPLGSLFIRQRHFPAGEIPSLSSSTSASSFDQLPGCSEDRLGLEENVLVERDLERRANLAKFRLGEAIEAPHRPKNPMAMDQLFSELGDEQAEKVGDGEDREAGKC
ncbi:MAG: hypothetical protein P4M11_07855 [Candidatus Pacebacteria bacterium]|nr:hypothetical protein [Candidatus Paceibacterota bacterium]